jgi:hypothetical protein
MPTTVSLVTGVASAQLNPGDHFVWVNPTNTNVLVANCGGFCTQQSYDVPANGEVAAQIIQNPVAWTFTETPNVYNNVGLGMPHVHNPQAMREKDVA